MKQVVNFKDEQLVPGLISENPVDIEALPLSENQMPLDELELKLQAEMEQAPQMAKLQRDSAGETVTDVVSPIQQLQAKFRKYQEMKQLQPFDENAIQDAINSRNRDQGLALVLKGAQQTAQGVANRYAPNFKADTSVADTLYKQAEQPVGDELMKQKTKNDQQKHNDIIAESMLKLESLNLDLTNMEENNKPDSTISKLAQELTLKLKPTLNVDQVNSTSAAQLFKIIPELQKVTSNELRRQQLAANAGKNDLRKVEGPDGKIYWARYNPETKSLENTGILAGFAPSIVKDSYTGENKMVSKGTVTQTAVDSNTPKTNENGSQIQQTSFEKLEPKYREDFVKNHGADYEKETKETQQKLSTLNSLNELANTVRNSTPENKRSNLNAFATAVASFYQKGVLSDKDVERYIKTPELRSRFMNGISMASSGTLDDTTVDQIMNGVNIIADEQRNFINTQAEEKSKQFYNKHKSTLDSKGIKPLDFAPMLNPDYTSKLIDPKIQDYAKTHNLTYEKAQSILKARGYNGK